MRRFLHNLSVANTHFRGRLSPVPFTFAIAISNAAIYNRPLYSFAAVNLDLPSTGGALTMATVLFLSITLTTLGLSLISLISPRLLKPFCMIAALCNAMALYFIETYGVVLDKTMIGNVFNTNPGEVRGILHPKMLGFLLAFGIGPCWILSRFTIMSAPFIRRAAFVLLSLLICLGWMYAASTTWLWIDRNSRTLGGLTLPWSYIVGAMRVASDHWPASNERRLLPPARFIRRDRAIVVLVIGESARATDFSLYGYRRNTNPFTTAAGMVALAHSRACATYTTASLLCMMSPGTPGWNLSAPGEPLPSYLQRHGIDVIWRTNNWGEPPINVGTYQRAEDIPGACQGDSCRYDESLLQGLEERIRASTREKVLVVLHLHGSHGPSYASEYPHDFEFFVPVCKSVVLHECTKESLVNAYDNSIRYTDDLLAQVIGMLKAFSPIKTTLMYISDHGESLGEFGLYLHGTPYPIAPDVQLDIPFLIWMSPQFEHQHETSADQLSRQIEHSHANVFHSILGALDMRSDVYDAQRDVFSGHSP